MKTSRLWINAAILCMVFQSCEKDQEQPMVITTEHHFEYMVKVRDYKENLPVSFNVGITDSTGKIQVINYVDMMSNTEFLVSQWVSNDIPDLMYIKVTAAEVYNKPIFVRVLFIVDGLCVANSSGNIYGSGATDDLFSMSYIFNK